MSENGRSQYRTALGSFVDRAATSYDGERAAKRTGCKGVTRSLALAGVARVRQALRCLARTDKLAGNAGATGARTARRRIRGEVNAARACFALRTKHGRRALAALAAGHAHTVIRSGDPTRVTLRVHG